MRNAVEEPRKASQHGHVSQPRLVSEDDLSTDQDSTMLATNY